MKRESKKFECIPGTDVPDIKAILAATSDFSEPTSLDSVRTSSKNIGGKAVVATAVPEELRELQHLGNEVAKEETKALEESQKKMDSIKNRAVIEPASLEALKKCAETEISADKQRKIEEEMKLREEEKRKQQEKEEERARRRLAQKQALEELMAKKQNTNKVGNTNSPSINEEKAIVEDKVEEKVEEKIETTSETNIEHSVEAVSAIANNPVVSNSIASDDETSDSFSEFL